MTTLADRLSQHYGVSPDRRGEYHINCPVCGAEAATRRGDYHASFSENGWFCQVCKSGGGLRDLANGQHVDTLCTTPPPPKKKEPPPVWRHGAEGYLRSVAKHPGNVRAWQADRPFTEETINRWELGRGLLPEQRADRLIVPVRFNGAVRALHGRALGDEITPKWICAKGSSKTVPLGLDNIQQGDTIWITENYADAILLMQEWPQYKAIAMGHAGGISEKFAAYLASRQPARVIVAFDNDLAGQAQGDMLENLLKAWQEKMRKRGNTKARPPVPSGPPAVNTLRRAGIATDLAIWPDDAPPKTDVGKVIMTIKHLYRFWAPPPEAIRLLSCMDGAKKMIALVDWLEDQYPARPASPETKEWQVAARQALAAQDALSEWIGKWQLPDLAEIMAGGVVIGFPPADEWSDAFRAAAELPDEEISVIIADLGKKWKKRYSPDGAGSDAEEDCWFGIETP